MLSEEITLGNLLLISLRKKNYKNKNSFRKILKMKRINFFIKKKYALFYLKHSQIYHIIEQHTIEGYDSRMDSSSEYCVEKQELDCCLRVSLPFDCCCASIAK